MADRGKCAYATYYTSGTSGEPGHHRCSCIAWGAKAAALIEEKDTLIASLRKRLEKHKGWEEDATAEIERLAARLKELEAAAKKLHSACDVLMGDSDPDQDDELTQAMADVGRAIPGPW